MAIVDMQKLGICASKKHRKEILEFLQSVGAMEIITSGLDDPDLEKMDTMSSRNKYEKRAESYDRVLKLLDQYAPENKGFLASLNGKEQVGRSQLDKVIENRWKTNREVQTILDMDKKIQECEGIAVKDENQITALTPWLALDIPMSFEGTGKTCALIGTIPDEHAASDIYAAASQGMADPAPVSVDVISADKDMTRVSVVCLKKDRAKVEENLRNIGFAKPLQPIVGIPAEEIEYLKKDIEEQKKTADGLRKQIAEYAGERESFRIAADYYRMRRDKYELLGEIPQSENVFFLEGWVQKSQAERIAKILTERYGAVVGMEEKREDEMEPTLLKNNSFSESAEGVLASYGLPQHGKVDPTFIMSIFYVIFFGMMLSDAGYGIIMAVACGIVLLKFKNLEEGLHKMIKLFFWCGLSTTFWGFMYGGFFGDAIQVIAETFFGYKGDTILNPLWFEPIKEPMRLLLWCMLFGLIHLYAGLGIKGYEYLKDHDIVGFVSDVLAWYLFVTGLVFILLPTDLFASIAGRTFTFPAFVAPLAKIAAIAGMLIILVMSGRGRKNWGLRIALGAYDIYGVTSWLSDVLSYSRLLALGLATGVIASVVNMMASMFGGGVIGVILFTLIFVLGHTLNIGINLLGAYVHTNRLQFVEFFGKFYEGGGKAFLPFRENNKYVEIKEEK